LIAVTGAPGFVGRHVVRELISRGHEVRGLVRPASEAGAVEGLQVVRGDIRNRAALEPLVSGAEAVVHLAASFSPQDDQTGIIVEGTQTLVAAAKETGVQRLVFMSCLGAEAAAAPILAAKWTAETVVHSAKVPFVILRPSLVLGVGDGVSRPLADLVRALPFIPIPGSGERRMQPVDVEDVARCIALAVERDDLVGETADLGGATYLTFRQLVDLVSGHLGAVKPKLLIPPVWLGALSAALPASTRGLFTPSRLAIYHQGIVASPGAVPRAFGLQPVSIVDRLPSYIS
jgi:NADH dehydrogenase